MLAAKLLTSDVFFKIPDGTHAVRIRLVVIVLFRIREVL